MTTTWPAAPAGTSWATLDQLLATTAPIVDAESRRGGVHQVRWEPSRRTRVAFDGADGDVVVLDVTGDGVDRRHLLDDAALGGLHRVLDVHVVAARLGRALGEDVRRVAIVPVSYRPGSRCVVRCDVATASGTAVVFVKVFADDVERFVDGHRCLVASATERDLAPFVPELVDKWDDLHAVVTRAAPGRSASSVLGDASVASTTRAELARRLGELLAAVHAASPDAHAARHTYTPAAELRELEGYLDAAWQADPAAAVSLRWLTTELAAATPACHSAQFAHGTFRAGQVVVGPDGALTLLDLDGVGLADPARDLGHAVAHLDWQHLRTGAGPFAAALVGGYRAGGGVVDDHAFAWWRAAALAKIAGRRYRSLDTATWAEVPALMRLGSEVLALGPRTSASAGAGAWPDVVDPSRMTAVLAPLLGARNEPAPTVFAAEVLQVAGGRRIVLRYRTSADLHDARRDVVVKVFAEPERATVTDTNLRAFARLADREHRVSTPAALGVLADRALVAFAAAPGRPLDALAPPAAIDAARRVGAWLRTTHDSHIRLGRRLDLDREATNLGQWAAAIGRAAPPLAAPAHRLAEQWASAAGRWTTVCSSPIHKDLHLGHVLVGDDGAIVVIDLDEARMGDPAFDVAHLVSNAEESPVATPAIVDAFLDGYGPLAGPDADGRYALFSAYTLLKLTKQRVLRAAPGELDGTIVDEGVRRLERGSSWLAA